MRKQRTNAFKLIKVDKPQQIEQVFVVPISKPIKIGYKGFYKDMSCNTGTQRHLYELGVVYEKPEKQKPIPCSADGFHYCNKLNDVFNYYQLENDSRYCEVEILGNHADDGDKSITTKIKVIREIPADEIEKYVYESNINLVTIRKIQLYNPFLHLGGSAALYLYGIKLDRIKYNNGCPSDIDMISPFYHYLQGDNGDIVEQSNSKNSGNDFDEAFYSIR